METNAVASSVHLSERKQFQSEISVGQLVNHDNVRRILSDDQVFSSFKNIRETLQYFHDMLLDILAKIRQFGVHTFFLTFSALEFHWTEITQVVACQYGQKLTDELVNAMDWSTKVNYLKRSPVIVARQINSSSYGVHPIVQILNYDK